MSRIINIRPSRPVMIAASWAPQIPAMAPVKMLPKAKAYIAMDLRLITLPRYSAIAVPNRADSINTWVDPKPAPTAIKMNIER